MTVLSGIDVSAWQPTTPNLHGLSFAFARATYGTVPDGRYAMHVANFRKAGLITGSYHFGTGATSGATQAAAFLAAAGTVDLYVLDLESNGGRTPMSHAGAREFIATVKAAGHKVGLYGSQSGFPALGQDYSWIANWSQVPSVPWAFHQYRGSPLDLDHFNGDLAALRKLAGKAAPPPPAWYHLAFTGGAFWVYELNKAGHITGRHSKRFSAPTGAPCGPLRHVPSDIPGGPRWLAKVTKGGLAGSWIGVPQPHVRYEVVR